MTVENVLALVALLEKEKKKDIGITYQGYSFEDVIHTDCYNETFDLLCSEEAKVFKCAECGKMLTWFDLDLWHCDFEKEYYICRNC